MTEPRYRDSPAARAAGVAEEIIDRTLVLRGEFEKEIRQWTEAREAAEAKLGLVKTVEQAEAVVEDAKKRGQVLLDAADRTLALAKEEAAQTCATADSILADAHRQADAVSEKAAVLTAREAALQSREGVHASDIAAARAVLAEAAGAHEAIAKREAAVISAEAALKAKTEELAEREKKFNERLRALAI